MWHKQLEDVNLMALCRPLSAEQVAASRFVLQSTQSTTTVFHPPPHTHTHICAQTHTPGFISSFQNRIFSVTEKEIHWQWSLLFLLTQTWKKKKKGHWVQEYSSQNKRDTWKHTHKHTKTSQDAVKYTLPTSANQHLRGQMVTGCTRPVLSQMISGSSATESYRATYSQPFSSSLLWNTWPVWTRQTLTCSVCTMHATQHCASFVF